MKMKGNDMKNEYRVRMIYLLFISLIFNGCASSPRAKRVEALQYLQEEVEKLKQTKADKADANVQLDDFKTELQILSGKVEEAEYAIKNDQKTVEQNNQRLDKVISDYDQKILALEKNIAELQEKIEEVGTKRKSQAAASDVKQDFTNGMKKYKEGDYSGAAALFARYAKNFPTGRSIQNARYFWADALYEAKDYQNAILKFEEYKEKYPKSDRVPEALYKQGLSFLHLGKKSDAKLFFSELVSSHGNSSFAKKAKSELDKLK